MLEIQDMLIIKSKALNNHLPVYIENMFGVRTNIKNLSWFFHTLTLLAMVSNKWSIQQPRPGTLSRRLPNLISLKSFKAAVRKLCL